MNRRQVAVVLSGCGVLDGAEITESIALFIALSQQRFNYTIFAPNRLGRVVDHLTGSVKSDSRSLLTEAARIARGHIYPIDQLNMMHFSALAFPGGAGVLQHFCNFIKADQKAHLAGDIQQLMQQAMIAKKPIIGLCAAPLLQALAAKSMGWSNACLTIGLASAHQTMADAIIAWGQQHIEKSVDQACVDPHYGFVSAPAYMYDQATAAEVFASCFAAVTGLQSLL